jgi:alpha-beta hydrolase superfamily lysophospholipase
MTDDVVKTVSTFDSVGRYTPGGKPAKISVKTWALPEVATGASKPAAVLQLNHGMCEYIDRYEPFAHAAAAKGWLVVGMDFLGHGDSVENDGQLGFSGVALKGRNQFVDDMGALRQRTQAEHPGVPYVMFAHSMGSFVLRSYLSQHGAGLTAAVACGTAYMAPTMVDTAKAVLGIMGVFHKPDYRSLFFASISTGPYNKPFQKGPGPFTGSEWLSRANDDIETYNEDPRCGFVFTLAADRLLMDAVGRANSPAGFQDVPKALPLLLMSGGNDPVGGMGTGVTRVAESYRRAGMTDVTLKLYPDARHELLNEINADEVIADTLAWIGTKLPA